MRVKSLKENLMMLDTNDLHDREAEERVLGGMMCDDSFVDEAIKRLSSVDSVFFTIDHQLIYNAIVMLRSDGKCADALLVSGQLEVTNDLNRAGGNEYLGRLVLETTETANGLFYCDRIVDLATRRDYRRFSQKVDEMAVDMGEKLGGINTFISESAVKLERQVARPSIKTVSLDEVMGTEYPDTPMIVPGILPTGLVLMAGEPKAGKSYAMMNLAIAAATGGCVWSAKYVEQATNVLYVAYESDYNEIKERTNQITGGRDVPDNLYFVEMDTSLSELRLDAGGIGMIGDYVTNHDIGLVIVDTWQRARPDTSGHKGNAYERDSDILAPVQTMTKLLGITTVLVHHTRKGIDVDNPFNEISGSAGFQAIPDAMMLMKREEDYNRLWIRGRRMMDAEYGVTIDVAMPGVVKLFELDDVSRNTNVTPVNQQILNVFAEHGVRSVAEVATELGKSEDSVKQAVYRMIRSGDLERAGRGRFQIAQPVDF